MRSSNERIIVYVSNTRLPTEKAHGLATMKICAALARCGARVELVVPALWFRKSRDPFVHYEVERNFSVHRIPVVDGMILKVLEPFFFLVQIFSFSLAALAWCAWRYRGNFANVIFMSHDYIPLYFISWLPGARIFYDIHHFPKKNFMYRRVLATARGFAVQTRWKIQALGNQFGIASEKIVYWPNGTDVNAFSLAVTKEAARRELHLPTHRAVVLYAGQFFDWKGVDTLVRAVPALRDDADVYLLGGAESDIRRLRERLPEANDSRIQYVAFQPRHLMPLWLRAADVLVLPNTGKTSVSRYYTSPMKLFEYMASGTPIVASAIPSILEIVGKESAVLAEADNPGDFAAKIIWVLEHPERAKSLGDQAKRDVRQYTWDNRAQKIIQFLEKNA